MTNKYRVFCREMGALFSKAGHIRYVGGVAGTAEAEGVINGYPVRVVGSMVERNTLDGPVPVLMVRTFVEGKQVGRRKLLELCGVDVPAKPALGNLPNR